MRGLDTNVLVRFVTRDDPQQAQAAHDLISQAEREGESLHISTVVLCGLVWVLAGPTYQFDRTSIAALLDEMLKARAFVFQARERMRRALDLYRGGGADFADYLIGEENRQAGCTDTLTFDRRLREAPGFAFLGSPAR